MVRRRRVVRWRRVHMARRPRQLRRRRHQARAETDGMLPESSEVVRAVALARAKRVRQAAPVLAPPRAASARGDRAAVAAVGRAAHTKRVRRRLHGGGHAHRHRRDRRPWVRDPASLLGLWNPRRLGRDHGPLRSHMVACMCPLIAAGCPLMAAECHLMAAECPLMAAECPLMAAECPLMAAECPLIAPGCPLMAAECHLMAAECNR